MLGLDACDGQLILNPDIPPEIGRITLTGTHAFGKLWDIEAVGTQSHVRLSPKKFLLNPPLPDATADRG
ncbi:hypothetical protein [Micromonospora pallida]|uniref:hypothetical protein n=1 Tax=Micromonospora pallida TaxID=145854 RepID=UPI000B887465|nr:hypothetical protein [Micromonospora pallida]